ncbi:hypothetical protein ANO11243_097490 [Dothideomycetidae sp. 11243]|nr:hypothetical protein ANO11243_097490 [fungal sp. No.11243]
MTSYAITGASRGIGLEFVRQVAQDPANKVFAIVRDTASSAALSELATRPNVHVIPGDLDDLASLQKAAGTVASETGGGLDVLINPAAFLVATAADLQPSQLTASENLDVFREMFDKSVKTNVFGAIYLTNSFLPLIEKGTQKKIVHISTAMADTDFVLESGVANAVPYSASKAMLNGVVAKYGAELRPKDIHVVALSPGWVDTSPMPKEALDWLTSMFRKVDPRVNGRVSAEDSVQALLKTISKLTWDMQGKMVSQNGNRNWF